MRQPDVIVTEAENEPPADADALARAFVRELLRLVQSGDVALPERRSVG
jgi:hypothetical protein